MIQKRWQDYYKLLLISVSSYRLFFSTPRTLSRIEQSGYQNDCFSNIICLRQWIFTNISLMNRQNCVDDSGACRKNHCFRCACVYFCEKILSGDYCWTRHQYNSGYWCLIKYAHVVDDIIATSKSGRIPEYWMAKPLNASFADIKSLYLNRLYD